ncbi:uncharacterized protein LOC119074219 [Bradysia coprophila]|uniref:uncharacterized protein LOC119074219 n=1 Tax=Bradysia coprophila TaxID=38358 RepID=UPI00187DCD9D|nr:uncharacterized protein LOC119074219 [Bradysia coprophila]
MGGKVVTFEEMVDLAIGSGCAINFCVLKKLLKLFSQYCCKHDYTFEIDMDNLSAEAKIIAKKSRSSVSLSQGSSDSSDSRQSDSIDERSAKDETKVKSERDVKSGYDEENDQMRADKGSQVYSSEDKIYDSSSDIRKGSASGSERPNQTETSDRKDSEKDGKVKEKKEKKHKKETDSHRKKDEESKRNTTGKHRKKSSDDVREKDSKKRKEGREDFSKLENRTNELENRISQLSDRIENITETIGTHLNAEHLAEINNEIDKLKKSTEITSDQCYETANSINDQSSQIQDILTTINDIQLRKVENEELIDLLSGKADYSFVDEKVSTSHFEDKIQELKDVIEESTIQVDSVRLETNTSLEEIKQELLTKLLAEEFDEAKTKIYKELIKLTEQNALILAQQNEHVAAGAKMRNLNCFVCDNDVVMLLEQEIIPKFRPLKASIPPLEPVVGSKYLIDKNAPEWQKHLLQTKDYARASKASRFHTNVDYQKSTYVKGRNGCMYKGNVGCDCTEAMSKRGKCCTVSTNNMKNISLTNRMNSESKLDKDVAIGDVVNSNYEKTYHKGSIAEITPGEDRQEKELKLKSEDVETTPEVAVKVERTVETLECDHETDKVERPSAVIQIKDEIVTSPEVTVEIERTVETVEDAHESTNVENSRVTEIKEEIVTTITINNTASINGITTIKTENDESATNDDAPVETNNVTMRDGTAENQ